MNSYDGTSARNSAVAGVSWMLLFKVVDRGLGFASTIILARLLVPADFGLVAMATSFIALLELLGAFSLDTVLIQRPNPGKAHFDAAWTMNIIAGAVIATLMVAFAWPLAAFYREPRLSLVICVLAIGVLVQSASNVGTVNFRRDLQFDREFRYLALRRVLPFLFAVPMAFWFRNYWALILGTVCGRVGAVALSYVMHPLRPRFSLAAANDLLDFSRWLVLHNVIAFFKDRSAVFVIGRVATPGELGAFTLSQEIASLPSTELVAPVNRALLPQFSRAAATGGVAGLRAQFKLAMGAIGVIAIPAAVGISATTSAIVAILLGPKWVAAAELIRWLAIAGIVNIMQTNAYTAFLALGQPRPYVQVSVTHVAILVPALLYFTPEHGALGAAWAYCLTASLVIPVSFAVISRHIGMRAREFLAVVWRPAVASAIMWLAVTTFRGLASQPASPGLPDALVDLLRSVAVGVPVYLAALAALWWASGRPGGGEQWLLQQVGQAWRRRRGA